MHGMSVERALAYLVVDAATGGTAVVADRRLTKFTERHPFHLEALTFGERQTLSELKPPPDVAGIVFVLESGAPSRILLNACERALRESCNVYFYWPAERAAELIDRDRLGSYWRLWFAARLYAFASKFAGAVKQRPASPRLVKATVGETADLGPLQGQFTHIAAEAEFRARA